MIVSFEQIRLDQVFLRREHDYEPRRLAELIWVTGNRAARDFLDGVAPERVHSLSFEALVQSPVEELDRLCRFLGLQYEPEMLDLAAGRRMTDATRPGAAMQGDPRFHRHTAVSPATADAWREHLRLGELSPITLSLARELGYEVTTAAAAAPALERRARRAAPAGLLAAAAAKQRSR
jgi:hypothetical protein